MGVDLVDALVSRHECPCVLRLFGGPFVSARNHRLEVPEGSKRLLVFVALHRGRIDRRYAAGTLWPIGNDERAAGNLRSALWRLNRARIDLVVADKYSLILRNDILIDIHLINEWATRLLGGHPEPGDLSVTVTGPAALDLLPGWYDDWVLLERERIRQRMLHALEALSHQLVITERFAEAVEAAMVAVGTEPLRESAQRVLLEAHLAEGNWIEGLRGYESYRAMLWRELRAEPSARLLAILDRATARSRRAAIS
jgi:DNA-binding SARP family transcriptional activator